MPIKKNTSSFITFLLLAAFAAVPFAAHAIITLEKAINILLGLFDLLIALFITIALVVFLWGVIKYILAGGDKTARHEGINFITWGIVALFVMISIWGLVTLLTDTFQVVEDTAPLRPRVLGDGGGTTGGTTGTTGVFGFGF